MPVVAAILALAFAMWGLLYARRGNLLLGGGPNVAAQAGQQISLCWPGIEVVGTDSPPFGFDRSPAVSGEILHRVTMAGPDLLVVGLGAPKQELWVYDRHREIDAKVAVCAGATLDFLAGHRPRSPRWMRHAGLEWFHRLLTEPRRLSGRYARDAWAVPGLIWREWRGSNG